MTTEALKKLHTAMLDTREGYKVAEKDAETPALKALFAQMIALRSKDHTEIHQALTANGEAPDESGSFMATVHKTMTSARSAVTGVNDGALGPFISGEESILGEYDAAIEEALGDSAISAMLTRQKEALATKVAEMKSAKAAV